MFERRTEIALHEVGYEVEVLTSQGLVHAIMGQELLANSLILDWLLLIKRPALSEAKHEKSERGHDQQHWDGLKQPKGNQFPH